MIETERLLLRKLTVDDFGALAVFLKKPEVMYAWEHGFSDEEVSGWIERNIARYKKDGIGYLLALEKAGGKAVGTIGAFSANVNGEDAWEAGYVLDTPYWGMGYAREGAQGCVDYLCAHMNVESVLLQMRTDNKASVKTAEALGGVYVSEYDREYNGVVRPYYIYRVGCAV